MAQTLKAATPQNRPGVDQAKVAGIVAEIIADVREGGDDAVRRWSDKLDSWSPPSFRLSRSEIDAVVRGLPDTVVEDIEFAQSQVRRFAQAQLASLSEFEMETLPGVRLGQKLIPIEASGAYVPGGRYPLLASAHMTVVTAKVAGVDRVAACTPPIRGETPAATIAAMALAGADEIYLLGGVQAIAALALGTETIDPVHLLTGPGNAYVAEAKRQLFGEVGIDLVAGPTETLLVTDETADPFVVAVDLLSQAEHGPDSPAVLITTSETVAREAMAHIEALLPGMSTKDMAGPAWRDYGEVHLAADLTEAYALANEVASEHVQILTANPRDALVHMRNYGALFLGEGTTVAYGDKVIGTNHVLPTRHAARYTGGLWAGMFVKTVSYQEVTDQDSSTLLGEVCARASRVELFEGHARSGDIRAAKYGGNPLDWAPEQAQRWAAERAAVAGR
ncbi:MAG TPA: histidinol dehydrogenase [Pseudonocardia sp.]